MRASMDEAPPSYQAAVTREYWPIVARYTLSQDLYSATLVCRRWNEIFSRHLWGNPASHFGIENDVVYVALTRFMRTLPWARLCMRELTHTLRLPPAHAEVYGGPHADWLRDILELLPNLQSLIVAGLPFFDHASLVTLRHPSLRRKADKFPTYGLRLLDASKCPNATTTGFAEALPHFPGLMYLDVSGTLPAKDVSVFNALQRLSGLRVLKLKGLGLRDVDIRDIARLIRTNVCCLDLRDNHLTDTSICYLLDHRFSHASGPNSSRIEAYENLDWYLRAGLTDRSVGHLAVEHSDRGLTHLYISENDISFEGVSALLRSGRLLALDVGSVAGSYRRPQEPAMLGVEPGSRSNVGIENAEASSMPYAVKLAPLIAQSQNLLSLRIEHGIITDDPSLSDTSTPLAQAELEDDIAIRVPPNPYDLSSASRRHELPTRLEREMLESSTDAKAAVGRKVSQDMASNQFQATTSVLLTTPSPSIGALSSDPEAVLPTLCRGSGAYPSEIVLDIHHKPPIIHLEGLHPSYLHSMRTLILTGVPHTSSSPQLFSRILRFITLCATARQHALRSASTTYALPPGRSRALAVQEAAREIFPLRRIVLEMADPSAPDLNIPRRQKSKGKTAGWRHPTKTYSSTEDPDSEAFGQAAAGDFSFFGPEECDLPDLEPGCISIPRGNIGAVPRLPADVPSGLPLRQKDGPHQRGNLYDTLAEISRFREEKRERYESAIRAAGAEGKDAAPGDVWVEGYWDGEITVVRPYLMSTAGDDVDFHGYPFGKCWNYR